MKGGYKAESSVCVCVCVSSSTAYTLREAVSRALLTLRNVQTYTSKKKKRGLQKPSSNILFSFFVVVIVDAPEIEWVKKQCLCVHRVRENKQTKNSKQNKKKKRQNKE